MGINEAGVVVGNNQEINLVWQKSQEGFIEQYLNEIDVLQNTKVTYRKALRQFFLWHEAAGIRGPTRSDILAYKIYLMEKLRPSTVSTYLSVVRSFFGWMESEKIYPNIAGGIKGAKSSRDFKKDALTAAQVGYIFDSLQGDGELEIRNFALFNLLVRTGLRTIEVHRANIEDMRNRGGQTVLYIQGKGRDHKDSFVVLTDAVVRPIYAYLAKRKERNRSAPLFVSLSNKTRGNRLSVRSLREIIKTAMRNAGYDDDRLTTHSLRHTAITLSLLAGASVQQAQQLARHGNINTTMIYAHNIDRIDNAPEFLIDEILGKRPSGQDYKVKD